MNDKRTASADEWPDQRATGVVASNSHGLGTVDATTSAQPYAPDNVPEGPARYTTLPVRLEMLLEMPPVSMETQIKYGWSKTDRSMNIYIKQRDGLTLHRNPVPQSTDAVRGQTGVTEGLHAWEVKWAKMGRGTHAAVGVATQDAPLHRTGYHCLVGSNDQSWGWDLGRSKLHDGGQGGRDGTRYPAWLGQEEDFWVPEVFLMVLDMDAGTLSFVADGEYLGVAFGGLKGLKLFPMVSTVWGHSEVRLKYVGGLDPGPLPLKGLCRTAIRRRMGKRRLEEHVGDLNMPNSLQTYLLYGDGI